MITPRWIPVVVVTFISATSAAGGLPPSDLGMDHLRRSFIALSHKKAILERDNRSLRLELALAELNSSYAIIDLRSRKLRFKIRGVDLQAYDLLDITVEGDFKAWSDSPRNTSSPHTARKKEDLGLPPQPIPQARSSADTLLFFSPITENPTPSFYDLFFDHELVVRVIPVDSVRSSEIDKPVTARVLITLRGMRDHVTAGLNWEAVDPGIRVSFDVLPDHAQTIFKTVHPGIRAILIF